MYIGIVMKKMGHQVLSWLKSTDYDFIEKCFIVQDLDSGYW